MDVFLGFFFQNKIIYLASFLPITKKKGFENSSLPTKPGVKEWTSLGLGVDGLLRISAAINRLLTSCLYGYSKKNYPFQFKITWCFHPVGICFGYPIKQQKTKIPFLRFAIAFQAKV